MQTTHPNPSPLSDNENRDHQLRQKFATLQIVQARETENTSCSVLYLRTKRYDEAKKKVNIDMLQIPLWKAETILTKILQKWPSVVITQ